MRSTTVFFAIFTATVMAAWAAKGRDSIALSATPAVVQKVINARVGSGRLQSIDKSSEGGEVTFDVEWTAQGQKDSSFTVAADGSLLSVGVELSDAPSAVQKTIQNEASGFELEGLEKDVEDTNSISYEVQAGKNGQEKQFTVSEDGTLLSRQVLLRETPEAVQQAIQKKTAAGQVKRVEQMLNGAITYDVTTSNGGQEKSFTVAADGALLSEQVALEEVPQNARKSIQQRIGDGTILRVDKSLSDKRSGVLPYEVQGRKDGKPFDFSIGPRGRFLGMDE